MNQPSLQAKEIGLLMKMYIIECTEDDLRALRVMYECWWYINGTHVANGFKLDGIEMIFGFICTEYVKI